jgi:pimeloyl-ACP methyl ester carboxylesterase
LESYPVQDIKGSGLRHRPASLPRLRQPTLILAGDHDPIISLVNAIIMHRLIPRSQLHVYHSAIWTWPRAQRAWLWS